MAALSTDLFDYNLPPHLIAQTPAARRDESRLLVVDRGTRTVSHQKFSDLADHLRAGDILFRNNAAVLPARLHARRPTGGVVECLLLRPAADEQTWVCLVKPARKLPQNETFAHPSGAFSGQIVRRDAEGIATVRFATGTGEPIAAIANRIGDVPLPPYIERRSEDDPAHDAERSLDLERYQTVYANRAKQVAVAAPTAGLHFTPELLAQLEAVGVRTAELTLHVGLGTFRPIAVATIEEHPIHREVYEIPVTSQRKLFPPVTGRRVAVGTTSVRTIEDFLSHHDAPASNDVLAEADLFVYPPRPFRGVDVLITNFHQPRSTLMCLVAAFLTPGSTDGVAWLRELYAEAIAREYRFFSYGDAMLIL